MRKRTTIEHKIACKKAAAKRFRESEKGIAYRKKWHEDNKDRCSILKNKYLEEHKEHLKPFRLAASKKYKYQQKIELFDLLGGNFCAECGCDIFKALELNHINGGGGKERRENKTLSVSFSKRLKYLKNNPQEIKNFNVLCRVCNAHHYLRDIKNIEGGTYQIVFIKQNDLVTHL